MTRNSLLLVAGNTSVSYAVILIAFLTNIAAISIIAYSNCPLFCAANFLLRIRKLYLESRPHTIDHWDMLRQCQIHVRLEAYVSIEYDNNVADCFTLVYPAVSYLIRVENEINTRSDASRMFYWC